MMYSKYLLRPLLLITLIIFNVHADDDDKTNLKHDNDNDDPIRSAKICSKCTCELLPYDFISSSVNCANYRLNTVPITRDLPANTRTLNLHNNNITSIDKFESINTLEHLSLSANGIKSIEMFAFEQLPNLETLDLSYNELSKILPGLFDKLTDLKFLNLSYNRIDYLPTDLFRNNKFLFELNLNNNPISYINSDIFANLSELEILHLAHNKIYSLEKNPFVGLKKLQRLTLADNLLENVPNDALRTIKTLQYLDLSENPFEILNGESFSGIDFIYELQLNNMPNLKRIEKYTFSSMINLQILSIYNNKHLSIINDHAFTGMFDKSLELKSLNLRRNLLSTISKDALPFCNYYFVVIFLKFK